MDRPKVGVGVIIVRNGKVLLGKRKNAHGEGSWCFPGGHMEAGETLQATAKREVKEETGMSVISITNGPYTNDIFEKEDKHYITLYVIAEVEGDPKVMEPEKCEEWEWFSWDALPKPLFISLQNLLKTGFRPD